MEDVEIRLLMGLNCSRAVRPRDIVCRNENEPHVVRTLLGWHANGPVNQKRSKQVHCNRIQILKSNTEDKVNGYIVAKTEIKERLTLKWFLGCLRWTLQKGNTESHYQEKTVSS